MESTGKRSHDIIRMSDAEVEVRLPRSQTAVLSTIEMSFGCSMPVSDDRKAVVTSARQIADGDGDGHRRMIWTGLGGLHGRL